MNTERLNSLRTLTEHCQYHDDGNDLVACTCAEPLNARWLMVELFKHIDELTAQRDTARDLAVRSGVFQTLNLTDYPDDQREGWQHEKPWRADPVGPVAWEKPIEQQR